MFTYKPLWKLLLERDMNKQDLRKALGFGPSTIAKMGKGEYVSLEVIDKICTYFGVPVEDVIEHIPGPEEKEKATEA
ncbi:putative transcriptional regulator [Paenibacillus larvae subsp. larvae]|uniref:Putative transcriptional regulator n=2 Tax=Paenibacillus larvae TaxID=1464 RepID=A0A2L1U4C5_9BACL|nr:helix-turn-helix transcriptional regulator [Paenibacillus larvae]AQT84138.1 XRE family transcriptional regulator [Paenibacillus larvae subsp. pulvifaciens]AQZ46115.1 XRE family transcriptional regulator [Paenibacillus larvae subsp. pulvifaciens]AVF27772.1 putative transcriptional regulator [Paenibacillus larvae subsp. larvae]AVF32275.1 putative transcriptional regulator [Paenibacillus larvae subsp. larvae]MCY7521976.1 helix-turn-helix transcriptional regulator [Paenibacillus larvae]